MADQTSPTPMSPVTFGPTVIPMSPTAEGTQPASAEPGVSSSDVGATRIPLIAPDPVLSTSSYECQRSGEQIDPLQTSDPWLSFYSGPGSQQALRDALWGTYGPTTTQLAAMPRTLNLPQSSWRCLDRRSGSVGSACSTRRWAAISAAEFCAWTRFFWTER